MVSILLWVLLRVLLGAVVGPCVFGGLVLALAFDGPLQGSLLAYYQFSTEIHWFFFLLAVIGTPIALWWPSRYSPPSVSTEHSIEKDLLNVTGHH